MDANGAFQDCSRWNIVPQIRFFEAKIVPRFLHFSAIYSEFNLAEINGVEK
jgi:hypothetical protein